MAAVDCDMSWDGRSTATCARCRRSQQREDIQISRGCRLPPQDCQRQGPRRRAAAELRKGKILVGHLLDAHGWTAATCAMLLQPAGKHHVEGEGGLLMRVAFLFVLRLHLARVIVDRDSGRLRGFGFVTYSTSEDAAAAVTAMDGKDLQYAGGNRGYGDGATGGYATNNASSTKYDSASGGRYGISGSYDIAGNSDGSTGGYNSPTTYGAGKHNPGAVGSGTFGEFSCGFRSGDSGSAGLNNGNNFTGSAAGDSYNRSTSTEGFSGSQTMGFGFNKVQYNGQDDLLGENFFDDKEAAGNI